MKGKRNKGAKNRQPWRFLSSYGLTMALLAILILLTLFGTLEQTRIGLFRSQQKYFNSLFVMIQPSAFIPMPSFDGARAPFLYGAGALALLGVILLTRGRRSRFVSRPLMVLAALLLAAGTWERLWLPLPGAYLVFVAFSINLLVSLVVRFRWSWKQTGLLVCHLGLAILLLGSYLTFHHADEGVLTLWEGGKDDGFVAYHQHELEIVHAGYSDEQELELRVPESRFDARIQHELLPFEVVIETLYVNCSIELDPSRLPPHHGVIGRRGGIISATPMAENSANLLGAIASIYVAGERVAHGAIIARNESVVMVGEQRWTLQFVRRRFDMPFEIELLHTRREVYPGTSTPRHFESRVMLHEPTGSREVLISMNRPLRHMGYTFFQSNFQELPSGLRNSGLSVVRNPAEWAPYLSCLLIFVGMSVHFLIKLARFLRRRTS